MLLLPNNAGNPRIVEAFSTHWAIGILLVLLPITLLTQAIRTLKDRKLKLVINQQGIWTPDFNYPWHEVQETGFKVTRGLVLLIIKTKVGDDLQVDLSELKLNTRFLGHQIERIKGNSEN